MMLKQIIEDQLRFLTFRQPSRAMVTDWRAYLLFGMAVTWLAGVGRYWDNPKAALFQHAGLGSVAYALCLSALLWALFYPLRPRHWQYRNVLLFVSLCSLPALLYAIPVERFMSMESAQKANAWFLGIVATWRVALLSVFLHRVAALRPLAVLIATLLPVTMIVVALTILNLEHVVFDIMAGIRHENRSQNDLAYDMVLRISIFSMMALPFLLLAYGILAYRARVGRTT